MSEQIYHKKEKQLSTIVLMSYPRMELLVSINLCLDLMKISIPMQDVCSDNLQKLGFNIRRQ